VTNRLARAVRERARTIPVRWDERATVGPPDESPDRMEALLRDDGVSVERWALPDDGFETYVRDAGYPDSYLGGPTGGNRFFFQKALEHWASLELAASISERPLGPGDVLVDVASNGGPFVDVVRRLAGSRCYENDLQFPPGVHGDRIGGDAAAMPVDDGFADLMTLHCSFDHFEGPSDTGFVIESARVLKPGGRVVIVPLYLSDVYATKIDPRLRLRGLRVDAGMHRFLMPGLEVRFSRLYDAKQLRTRVLGPARAVGLDATVFRVEGGSDLVTGSYLNFALVLERPARADGQASESGSRAGGE
jgi:SAM-dependent methyltransferase